MAIESVRGREVVIHFDGARCIHSRHCVLDRPDVFVPNVAGEWIRGRVLRHDGQGVVVVADDGDVCVLRMDAISCVRVPPTDVRTAHVPPQPDGERARIPTDHLPATT